jgi:D-alanyl-D-alanine carboxypeptidase
LKAFRFGSFVVALVGGLLLSLTSTQAAIPLSHAAIIKTFDRISQSKSLANPSIILIDRATGEVIYEKNGTVDRKPASVMKLLSAAVALQYIDPESRFVTKISLAPAPRTLVLSGEFDPWMAYRQVDALKDKRASLTYLGHQAIGRITSIQGSRPRTLSVMYSGVYVKDIRNLSKYFRSQGVKAKFTSISNSIASASATQPIATVSSPPLKKMVEFALLWSDNVLANRLALSAATAMGLSRDRQGVALALKIFLTDMQIDTSGLLVQDGSGLSKKNRVTAELVADLLLKIRGNDDFSSIYDGLPISGISGTLEDRFLTTAPQAVGLVHAKTGTLDGTVSLAGYVDAGQHEYIFVAIADHIHKGEAATDRARITLDRLVGRIASPLTKGP